MGTLEQTEQVSAGRTGRNKRSLRGLLIDKRFQLKYTLIVVFLAVVLSTVLGYLLVTRVTENTTLVLDNMRATEALAAQLGMKTAPETFENMRRALVDRDRESILFLVLSLVGLVLALTVMGIYVTHKVAGPIYVMTRYLREIGSGNLRDVRALRRGDELLEFYETFQNTLRALQERERRDIATLDSAIRGLRDQMERLSLDAQAEGGIVEGLNRAVESLAELKKAKQEALG